MQQQEIVVGLDQSEHSRQALVWPSEEAARRHLNLGAVHALTRAPRAEGSAKGSTADVAVRLRTGATL